MHAREAFITAASAFVLPVVEIDGMPSATGGLARWRKPSAASTSRKRTPGLRPVACGALTSPIAALAKAPAADLVAQFNTWATGARAIMPAPTACNQTLAAARDALMEAFAALGVAAEIKFVGGSKSCSLCRGRARERPRQERSTRSWLAAATAAFAPLPACSPAQAFRSASCRSARSIISPRISAFRSISTRRRR